MGNDAFFVSLLCVGQQAGCSKQEVAEALMILRQNGIQTCVMWTVSSSCVLQDFREAQGMQYRSFDLPCPCKRVVKCCLRLVAIGDGLFYLIVSCTTYFNQFAGAGRNAEASRSTKRTQETHVFEMLKSGKKTSWLRPVGQEVPCARSLMVSVVKQTSRLS